MRSEILLNASVKQGILSYPYVKQYDAKQE